MAGDAEKRFLKGHDGKELAQELAQKHPPFPRLRKHPPKETIGHKNQGSAGVSDQKQERSIRLISESIAGRSALRK